MKRTAILFLLLTVSMFAQENLEGNLAHIYCDLLGPFGSTNVDAPWSQGTVHDSTGNYDSSWVQRYADFFYLYNVDTLLMREDYSAIDGIWNHVKRGIYSTAGDTINYFYDAPIGTKILPEYDSSPEYRREWLDNGQFISMDVEYRYFIQNDGTVHFAGMPDEDSSLVHIAGKISGTYLAVFYIGNTENPGFRYFLIDAATFPSYDLQSAVEVTFENNIRPMRIWRHPGDFYIVEDTAGNLDVYNPGAPGQFNFVSHIASNATQYWYESSVSPDNIIVLQVYPSGEDSINQYSVSLIDTTYSFNQSFFQAELGSEFVTGRYLNYLNKPIYNTSGEQIIGIWHVTPYNGYDYQIGYSLEIVMDILPGRQFFYNPDLGKLFIPRYDFTFDTSKIIYDAAVLDSDFSGSENTLIDASALFPEGYIGGPPIWYVNGEFAVQGLELQTELTTGTHEIMFGIPKTVPSHYYYNLSIDVYAKEIDLGADVVDAVSSYGDYVYVPTEDNKIFCFDDQGGLITQLNTQGTPSTHISITNGRLAFMTDAGKLYCTDSLLNILWQKEFSEPVKYAPLIYPSSYGPDSDILFLFAGDSVMNFSAKTGFHYYSAGLEHEVTTQPVIAANVYGPEIALIYGFDQSNLGIILTNLYLGGPSMRLFEFALSDTIAAVPSVDHQYAYVHTKDGYFYRMLWYLSWGSVSGVNDTLHHSDLHSSSPALITEDKDIYIINDTDDSYTPTVLRTRSEPDSLIPFQDLVYGKAQVSASPWLSDDHHIYVPLTYNRLQVFNLIDPNTLEGGWIFQAKDSLTAHPLVTSENVVFLPEKGGKLYLLKEPEIGSYKGVSWATFMGDGSRNKVHFYNVDDIDDNSLEVPEEFSLRQNYPNPFNPETVIEFDIPEETAVSLVIYDILGNKVAEPVNSRMNPGTYKFAFNASGLASGIYFYRLRAGRFSDIKKMILLR